MPSQRPVIAALVVVLAACGATRPVAPRPGREPEPRAAATRAAVTDAAATVDEPAIAPELEVSAPVPSAAPTRGTYWVRRESGLGGSMGHPAVGDEAPIVERWAGTRCVPITIDDTSITIEAASPLRSVRLRRVRDAEVLVAPTLTIASRAAIVEGACESRWDPAGAIFFEDRAACEATPDTSRERCRGEQCVWDDPRARPLTLPGCDEELASLAARASLIESASHDASRRTLASLERLIAHGGQLFERRGETCAAIAVARSRADEAILTSVELHDGWETTTRTRYVLEPLFGRAIEVAATSVSRSLDGGMGGRGASGGPHTISLALGDGAILLGHRTLYLRERDCEAPAEH